MKLSQALKEKKRMAGEVTKLQAVIVRENSYRKDNTTNIVVMDLIKELDVKTAELAKLKSSISKANVPVWDLIFQQGELKAYLTFLDTIPTKTGIHSESGGYSSPNRDIEYTAQITNDMRDIMKKEVQDKINDAQDKLDAFNAVTEI